MKKNDGIDFILGIIAGIVIYVLALLVSGMIYLNINDNSFELVFCIFILMGSAFMIIALLYKKPSVLSMIIRFLAFLISFVVVFLEIAGSGLLPFMEKLMKLDASSASENVAGLMMGHFLIVVLLTAVITIMLAVIMVIIKAVVKRLKNLKKNR
ncbi:MAG: hypothetical protein ACOYJX_00930 [Acutalibacteraceae bacterium]|jgi:hypothetical protein